MVFDVAKDDRSEDEEEEEEAQSEQTKLEDRKEQLNMNATRRVYDVPEVKINGESVGTTGAEKKALPVSRRKG